jgi:hypothetical protein
MNNLCDFKSWSETVRDDGRDFRLSLWYNGWLSMNKTFVSKRESVYTPSINWHFAVIFQNFSYLTLFYLQKLYHCLFIFFIFKICSNLKYISRSQYASYKLKMNFWLPGIKYKQEIALFYGKTKYKNLPCIF